MVKKKAATLLLLVTFITLNFMTGLTTVSAAELGYRTLKEGMQGDDVTLLQNVLKTQGFFKEKPTGYYGPKTKEAVIALQKAKGLTPDGIAGRLTINYLTGNTVAKKPVSRGSAPERDIQEYIVKDGDSLWLIAQQFGTTVDVLKTINNLASDELSIGQKLIIPAKKPHPESTPPAKEGYGEYADWWTDAQYAFPIGAEATVRDYDTGKTFKIKRSYGVNHADVEPLTADDTAVMKELYPKWGWNTRAIIVEVGDRKIAASMSAMPHSIETIGEENDFNGHFDIHFLNSRSHNTNKVRPEHQAMVRKAAGQ